MAKALTLGNGSMLVGIDERGEVRDLYYPYVGLENHISSASGTFLHRVGVYVDGTLRWLDHPSFKVEVSFEKGTMAGITKAVNEELGVALTLGDIVDHQDNIFVRDVVVENTRAHTRTVKLFFAQQFRISEDKSGSTGFYDPRVHSIIHYKGKVAFLIGGKMREAGFDDYSIGLFNMESHDGTYIDAEDGMLSKNPIEHGSVDSVIRFTLPLLGGEKRPVAYWVIAGESIAHVHRIEEQVRREGHEMLGRRTRKYWSNWLTRGALRPTQALPRELSLLYERSLLVLAAHQDKRGGIIASSDSDMLNYGRDTYSYVWPRDGALIAHAFDVAGYPEAARAFFVFMSSLVEPGGYLMHKYRPDGALGSSWHPWIWHGKPSLPIQEDETATVLAMLSRLIKGKSDSAFVKSLYQGSIRPMSAFLLDRIDGVTKLPGESYDLWEEVYGTSTYTASSVYAGLVAAERFADMMGERAFGAELRRAAERMRDAIGKRLFDPTTGAFLKFIRRKAHGYEEDHTLDISGLHGVLSFGVLPPHDERVTRMYEAVERELHVPTEFGGYMRYAGDRYYRLNDGAPPNPWVVTTMWVARYHIEKASTLEELAPALELLKWAEGCASPTGMLSEQMNPYTGEPLSATPLVWSHAEYILTVHAYLNKLKELES